MPSRRVALITLGCARNEVDSEELAARLEGGGWSVVDDAAEADAVLVNTCGFVETAKQESVDTLLDAADDGPAVVAVGCLAERYGRDLAEAMPEAAVLGFDHYPDIAARLDDVVAGRPPAPHVPRDRRTLLPITPVDRQGTAAVVPGHRATDVGLPGRLGGPRALRRRLGGGPVAPLKIASGCDRRCAFCAIPSFRGAFVSRPPAEVVDEAGWLAGHGARELVLVSENSTSYGKDLGDVRLLEGLLTDLTRVDGVVRVRVSYLQPAEMRPSLVDVMTSTDGLAPYFDLSFQHASGPLLRRMRRFGDGDAFLGLLGRIRAGAPQAGARTNVIVGFPGERERDVELLEQFLTAARLDAIGVFGYSDEDGTEAAGYDAKVPEELVAERVERIASLVEELVAQRAEERVGDSVDVLVESVDGDEAEGCAAHQGPDTDGTTTVRLGERPVAVGDLVRARVAGSSGVDLVAEAERR
ncbi:MAG: 30S ribosomal protein S12 methylthiotransferase RimO [Streptosporangiales bacterium]|nr:30S ribosomal protein S12 methylthiotransferase RimO [Streptosporangiales bacterium]MBO0891107.1 30S ribosomal protein S12 methylthiotransferase RimO [Acidothermales bacterium]